jgi:hypothetical protein
MNRIILVGATLTAALAAVPAAAKEKRSLDVSTGTIVFYDGASYSGRGLDVDSRRTSIDLGFNIKSIAIHQGEKWRICAKPRLREPCLIITESVPDATVLGIYGGIGSLEPIKE